MEALGIVANVIAVVDLSVKLGVVCGEYITKAFNATDDIRKLQDESRALAQNIGQALDLLGEKSNDENHKRQLAASVKFREDVKKCEKLLGDLTKRLDPGQNPSRFKIMGKSLMWPVTSKEVAQTIDTLRAWRSSFDTALQVDTLYITRRMEDVLHLTNLPGAAGAAFDDYDNENEAICHPDTRKDLLHQIVQWSEDPDGKCMFWLRGSAGTGKSTISRTVARLFSERKQLGGSFFFNRTREGRNKADMFVTTIARQFIRNVPILRDLILAAIQEEPELAGKALQAQFQKLILEPLKIFEPTGLLTPTLVLVVDALDECDTEASMGYDPRFDRSRMIVGLLGKLAGITNIRVRVFITSRPEVPIRLGFRDDVLQDAHQDVTLHDIPLSIIQHDIKAFVERQLESIRASHRISTQWPGNVTAAQLVDMSIPLFIYAATLCKFLQDRRFHPKDQLEKILSQSHNSMTRMEMTYSPVLNQLLLGLDKVEQEGVIGQFRKIVGSIILLADPLPVVALSQLLNISVDEISCHLDNLHSVLSIPEGLTSTGTVQILHLSFREYLLDNSNGRNRFCVDELSKNEELFECCLQLMTGGFGNQDGLRKDICKLGESEPGVLRKEVPAETIRECIPRHLEYACLYWVHHLERSQIPADSETRVYDFLRRHFLFWLEAMSWLGCIDQSTNDIRRLQAIWGSSKSQLAMFMYDAGRFLGEQKYCIDLAPYQTYVSALLFSPTESLVKQAFQSEVPSWVLRAPQMAKTWNMKRRRFQNLAEWARAVVYSHDGSLLAIATRMEVTVSLVASEAVCGAKNDFIDEVTSIAFTSNNLIAVGLGSGSVVFWDWMNGSEWTDNLSISRVCYLSSTTNGGIILGFEDGRVIFHNKALKIQREWRTFSQSDFFSLGLPGRGISHSTDGRFIAIFPDGHMHLDRIDVYDADSGVRVQELRAPEGHCFGSFTMSSGHKLLALSARFHTDLKGSMEYSAYMRPEQAQIWDLNRDTDVPIRQLSEISGIDIGSMDGDDLVMNQHGILAATSLLPNQRLSIWDLESSVRKLEEFSYISHLCFSPNGRLIAGATPGNQVDVIDVHFLASHYLSQENPHQKVDAGSKEPILWNRAVCSPDNSQLATISLLGTINIWDCSEKQGRFVLPDGPIESGPLVRISDPHLAMHWTWNGSSLIVALSDQLILFNVSRSITLVRTQGLDGITGRQNSKRSGVGDTHLSLSPCGSYLAMSETIGRYRGDRARILLWDFPTFRLRWMSADVEVTQMWPHSLAFSPDGKYLASLGSSKPHVVNLMDSETGDLRWTASIDNVYQVMQFKGCIAFDSFGSHIVVRVWNLDGLSNDRGCVLVFNAFSGDFLARSEPISQWGIDHRAHHLVASIDGHRIVVEPQFWHHLVDEMPTMPPYQEHYDRAILDDPCCVYNRQLLNDHWLTMDNKRLIHLPASARENVNKSSGRCSHMSHRFSGHDTVRDAPFFIDIDCFRCKPHIE